MPAQHSLSVEGIDICGPPAADELARKAGFACHAARHAVGRFGGSKPDDIEPPGAPWRPACAGFW